MTFPSLVDAIYEAALRPARWQSVLEEMALSLNARDCSIGTYNFETKAFAADTLPLDPDYLRRYDEEWAHRNFLWQATHLLPAGTLFSFEAAMPRRQFEKTEFFNEWWLPQGMTRALGVNLVTRKAYSSVATFYRPSSRPEFEGEEALRLREWVPHLARAMEIRQELDHLAGIADDFRASLERLGKPALLVDADCQLQFANEAAERLLRTGDLRTSPNSPIATGRADQTRSLHRLIREVVCSGGHGGRIGLQRSAERPLTLSVFPLHRSASPFVRRSALILIDDPAVGLSCTGSEGLLQSLYRLTISEAQLALLIASGKRLHEAAEERGISLATAKTHLAHIFQKTAVSTQGELIRLLITSGILGVSGAPT